MDDLPTQAETPVPSGIRGDRYFHWRGGRGSAIEAFSTALIALSLVFFALAAVRMIFLVEMGAFVARVAEFFLCGGYLAWFWYVHHLFHRRFGLQDGKTVAQVIFLVMLAIFGIFPMQVIVSSAVDGSLFGTRFFGLGSFPMIAGVDTPPMEGRGLGRMLLLFSVVFVLGCALSSLLYRRVLKLKEPLGLTRGEEFLTRLIVRRYELSALVALLAAIVVAVDPRAGLLWLIIFALLIPAQIVLRKRAFAQAQRDGVPLEPVV